MNVINVETFLAVAYNQNFREAAQTLCVTQSTISTRLQQLEDELGVTLILRSKGVRSIKLTTEGQAFIPLAERWMSLYSETEKFSSVRLKRPFTIASPDSLNVYLFQPFYNDLTAPDKNIALRIRTHQSPEIFTLVENNEADVGFAFHLFKSSNVICAPLFSEKMLLLCSKYGDWPSSPISYTKLNPQNELFLSWSQDIQRWHDSCWGTANFPYVNLDNVTLFPQFMEKPQCWCICPASVANRFLSDGQPVEVHELLQPPPNRVCYFLTHRVANNEMRPDVYRLFFAELNNFLLSQQEILQMDPNAVNIMS